MGKRSSNSAVAETVAPVPPSTAAGGLSINSQTIQFNPSESASHTDTLDKCLLKQVNHFVRSHSFIQQSLTGHTTSLRRAFERDVYDYARGVGLSKDDARKEVRKARSFCGELDHDSDVSVLGDEVDDSATIITQLATRALPASQKTPRRASTSKRSVKPTSKSTTIGNIPTLKVQNPPADSSKKSKVNDTTDAIAVDAITETSQPSKKAKKRKSDHLDRQPAKSDFATAVVDGSSKDVKKSKHKHDESQISEQASLPGAKELVLPRKVSEKSKVKVGENKIKSSVVRERILNSSEPKTGTVVEQAKSEKQKNKKSRKTKEQSTTGTGATEVTSAHAILTPQHNATGEHSTKAANHIEPVRSMNDSTDITGVPAILSHPKEKGKKPKKTKKSLKQERCALHAIESGVISNEKKKKEEKSKEKKDSSKSTKEQSQFVQDEDPTVHRELEARMKELEEATNQSPHFGKGESVASYMQATNSTKHLQVVEKKNDLTATPEAVSSNSDHEKTSAYFPPSNQKSKKQHLEDAVELSPSGVASSKVKTQMQINKEKAAQFRAELAAERRLSCGPAATSFVQGESAIPFNGVYHQGTQKPSEPTSKASIPIRAFASISSVPSEVPVQSPNESSAIGNPQEPSVPHELTTKGQMTPTKKKSTKKNKSIVASDDLIVDMTGTTGVHLDLASIKVGDKSIGIEAEIPESRSEHNGWFPVNLDPLVTDKPADLNFQTATGDFSVESGVGIQDQKIPKKRKGRADIARGTEGIEEETPKKKSRKIKHESVDFPSPMIQ